MITFDRKKVSLNRKTLGLVVMLSMISGVVIIILFYATEMLHIHRRAVDSLHEVMEQVWLPSSKTVPDIFSLGMDEEGNEYLTVGEQELLSYYLENKETIPLNKVQYFRTVDCEMYYFVETAGEEELIYTDVSFTTNTVRTATYVLLVVVGVISVLVYLVSRHATRVLDAKDESMKEFFANASHELKTPIMAVRGYSDGMRDGIVTQQQACQIIEKETERMTALINDILELCKLDSGLAKPNIEECDIREILYDDAGVIETHARQRGIHLSMDMPEPLLCKCDEDMLFSAFSNVLTNSIRYAGSTICIKARRKESSDGLRIKISNDGTVISEEDAEHLFERFYKGAQGQTGIGMALCREYIELHHGTIVVSAIDGRTVFEICLV